MAAPASSSRTSQPHVDDGRYPIKRVAGEQIRVTADIFADGHDSICALLLRVRQTPVRARAHSPGPGTKSALSPLGQRLLDGHAGPPGPRAGGSMRLSRGSISSAAGATSCGRSTRAASTSRASWLKARSCCAKRPTAAKPTLAPQLRATADVLDGRRRPGRAGRRGASGRPGRRHGGRGPAPPRGRRRRPFARASSASARAPAPGTSSFLVPIVPDPSRGSTLSEAARRLPAVAAMGFDVVYLPPIHPDRHHAPQRAATTR